MNALKNRLEYTQKLIQDYEEKGIMNYEELQNSKIIVELNRSFEKIERAERNSIEKLEINN